MKYLAAAQFFIIVVVETDAGAGVLGAKAAVVTSRVSYWLRVGQWGRRAISECRAVGDVKDYLCQGPGVQPFCCLLSVN